MIAPLALLDVRVATPMPASELERRMGNLLAPEDGSANDLCGFEFTGTVHGSAFRLRRISRGPMTRFIVPEVTGVIESAPDGALVRAAIRPTARLLVPPALLVGYAVARSGAGEAQIFVPAALVLGFGLSAASLLQEIARARRFLEGLARPPA